MLGHFTAISRLRHHLYTVVAANVACTQDTVDSICSAGLLCGERDLPLLAAETPHYRQVQIHTRESHPKRGWDREPSACCGPSPQWCAPMLVLRLLCQQWQCRLWLHCLNSRWCMSCIWRNAKDMHVKLSDSLHVMSMATLP